MYRSIRLRILSVLYQIPPLKAWAYKRLPRHRSGYKHYWITDKVNILGMRGRIAENSAIDRHPTIAQIRHALDKYHPQTVLEAGCGYGRLLKQLAPNYDVTGCDLAPELLQEAFDDGLKVFMLDLANPTNVRRNLGEPFDVVFTRAVFMFMIDHRDDTWNAMYTLDQLATKKVIIWEWPHVCDYMRSIYPSSKFEYHSTPVWAG